MFGLLVGIVAWIAGIAASLAAASLTPVPLLFLLIGAAVYAILVGTGIAYVYRRHKRSKRFRAAYALGAILLALTAFALLKPLDDPQHPPDPIEGLRYWELSTGSTIAYKLIAGKGTKRPDPIVFLHGGPATPDMAGDAAYFGRLAAIGYDVYVYDQLGAGRSSRLQDPRGYKLSRDVADLEAIRQRIGAERMILVGHSYGCEIAAHYMAQYRERVARAVLSSPGAIDSSDRSDAQLTARLAGADRRELYRLLLQPRVLFAYALLQINPKAAHAFAGDEEMDARFDRVYAATEPALHAAGNKSDHPVYGMGFYANQFPQSRAAVEPTDIRPMLKMHPVPALIIKGSDDYLSWSSAMDYRKALPQAQLLYVEAAGHNAYQDQPDIVWPAVRAFLSDGEPPYDFYESQTPPVSFKGAP
ncbi:alpha/beta fold hydrolase [Cohnella sp. REN36]|uniref:alpha/beta fold hydrolase n=1 Tax=Cohnella sp. REN36 TaxID=2887347 RepID=UPI001D142032|nr:alpha/beta hydrolase [Cohnella sp. REN36]MCC3373795.1 alpha/beta hydrolase [Cohnella sp. REN36]